MRNLVLFAVLLTLLACSTAPKTQPVAEGKQPPAKESEVLFISDQRAIPLNFPDVDFSSWLDTTIVQLESQLPKDDIPRNVWISVVLKTDGNHTIDWTVNPKIDGFRPHLEPGVPLPQYKDFKLLYVYNRYGVAAARPPQNYIELPKEIEKTDFFLLDLAGQNQALQRWCNNKAMPIFEKQMQEVVEQVPALKDYMDYIGQLPDSASVEEMTEREKLFWLADAEFKSDRPLMQYYRLMLHIQHGEYDKASSLYSSIQYVAGFVTPLSLVVQDAVDYVNIMMRQVSSDLNPITTDIESGESDGATERLKKVLSDYPKSPLTWHYLLFQQYPQYYREHREEDFAQLYREKVYQECDPLFMDSYPAMNVRELFLTLRYRLNLFTPPNQFNSEIEYLFVHGQMCLLLDAPGYAAPAFRRGMDNAPNDEIHKNFYLLYIYCLDQLGIDEMNYDSAAFPIPETLIQEASQYYQDDILSIVDADIDSLRENYEPVIHLSKGLSLFQAEANEEAKKELNQCIEMNPDIPEAFTSRGKIYFEEEKYDLAERDYTRAIELGSQKPSIYYVRSTIYAMQSKWPEAIQDINTYLGLEEDNYYALFLRGVYYQNAQRYEESIRDFSWLINQVPDLTDAWLKRGISYYLNGENGFALKDFDHYLYIQPEDDFGYAQRAIVRMRLDQIDQALMDIDTAIEINGDAGFYYKAKGDILSRKSQFPEAIAAYKSALQKNDFPLHLIYYFMANAYFQMEDYNNAIRTIDLAIGQQPDEADYYRAKASYLNAMGNLDQAITVIDKAIELDPENPQYYSYKAAYLYDNGMTEKALEVYRYGCALDPDDMSTLLSYAELLILTGHYAEAEPQIDIAIQKSAGDHETVIALFLKVIALKLQGKPYDTTELEKYMYPGLKLYWWSFDLMEDWLDEKKISDADAQYIRSLIEQLKAYKE